MKFFIFAVLMLFIQLVLEASPLPAVGSSYINKIDNGSIFSVLGFELKNLNSDWILTEPAKTADNADFQQVDFKHKKLKTIVLSLKKQNSKLTVDAYVKKSIKDYNQYGFNIISTQQMTINQNPAVVIDLIQKNNITQSRQVFFQNLQTKEIVTATCLDTAKIFADTSKVCNSALNSFNWK